ncbi:MAG: superoxide dismutase [Candidatus Geothermincolia bacterium]
MADRTYSLPDLDHGYDALAPWMSEEQLRIHHDKHHLAYVNGANAALEKLDKAHAEGAEMDIKAALKDLSWNIGGHLLHSLFWQSLAKGGGAPSGDLASRIETDFGGLDQFKKEFTKVAVSVEGSGWAALTVCPLTRRLLAMQIEKHNTNVYPAYPILLVLDVFEHAYYIDYKNDRAKFVEGFWDNVAWSAVADRLASTGL